MLEKALSGIRESLLVDGYELFYEKPEKGVINIVIKAGPDACAECLIPEEILKNIISNSLEENGISYKKVNIQMP